MQNFCSVKPSVKWIMNHYGYAKYLPLIVVRHFRWGLHLAKLPIVAIPDIHTPLLLPPRFLQKFQISHSCECCSCDWYWFGLMADVVVDYRYHQ